MCPFLFVRLITLFAALLLIPRRGCRGGKAYMQVGSVTPKESSRGYTGGKEYMHVGSWPESILDRLSPNE